jgi:uncharacterized damage-inducible protein DinB
VKIYKAVSMVCCLLVSMSAASFAQASAASKTSSSAAADSAPTISSVLDNQLSSIEREVMAAAEAIPDDKFDWSPATANIPGDFKTPEPVRSFSQQFKHMADALEAYSSAVFGQKREASGGENGPSNVKSKSDTVNYVKAAFSKAHDSIKTINAQNATEQIAAPFGTRKVTRLGLAVQMIGHTNNHYGQIIEYLRMNGIVPPESRRTNR